VPILFWRKGIAGFEQPLAVETVDIAPTLAGLIGLPLAAGAVDGKCLDLVAGPGSSCP
jgi:arylsulfatase A-like enzyme